MRTVNYLEYDVLNESYLKAREEIGAGAVITISPNSYGLATQIPDLKKALKAADILVLDGVYFGLGYFLRTGKTIEKNQGPDIFYNELSIQNKLGGRVFFLGSTKKTLELISQRLKKDYPGILFETMSPPYKEKLEQEDNKIIEEAIKKFKPDVVMVGMSCPKQEIWINENIERYTGILFLGIGGVFDWFAGNYKELHPLWWKLRIGWIGRIIQRPEVLQRNLPYILIYLNDMIKSLKTKG